MGSDLKRLIHAYQSDSDSRYRKLRYASRRSYDSLMARLVKDHGNEPLSQIRARTFLRWYSEWSAASGITRAHSLIGMLRALFSFGMVFLEDDDCERLHAVLHGMKFEQGGARKERLTADQAIAIRAKAHELGLHSIALAQAIQFEGTLRQKDVIGEWVPLDELGTSDILTADRKWLRGVRWSEIDDNLILTHVTSKRGKEIVIDFHHAPMVMEELARLPSIPRTGGPVIVSEFTGLPYKDADFRFHWRRVARAAGVPDQVFNMDSRAGAISEATDAGADLESVRHAATHSDISMTQRYSRGSVEKVAGVMKLRAQYRAQATGNVGT